ncbi:MAG: hydrogen gas-evolving membrane-bound hydrogenase subunit E [Fervidobacterium sp.]|uniref:Membrane bound protein complex subunit mbxF n=1 Tax=Fervidobacterium gondwanense DSM 13020 TaxID=1121883 RepID=A0A1M7RX43_FERGO|nr:hydrogen gas-evolving membrane-bound hydrogenase subunit E [Fervidobacterium gondwanense]UXF00063.1 cation:proton antiporter [Fervidobacterium riparium]SHN50708.1 Membrane bound protein complex subunit mbxF [Fervidobacterium gondwanense DSM 13020]
MRRIWAILLSAVFLYFFFTVYAPTLPEFGMFDMYRRVSFDYISKSTTKEYSPVEFKKSSNLEEGSANVVTSIVVNYRSFDTLGEVTVLFTAALGVGLLASYKKRRIEFENHNVLSTATGIVLPIILLFGAYIFIHGHLTPGGGFPGGTIIGLGVLLLILGRTDFKVSEVAKYTEGVAGAGYVLVGLVGIALAGTFLANFLPTGTVGYLFSAGVVPIVYTLIGFKVGAELSNIISEMREG